MQVACKQINGRFRIVGPDGKVEKNAEGTAVDGGGHDDEAACQKQARAINASISAAYVLIPKDTEAWELSDGKQKIYRKEIVYAGNFEKRDPKTGKVLYSFSVDSALLDHWKRTIDDMVAEGVEIPVPVEHTLDPEKRRASVVGCERGINKKGLPSLRMLSTFTDPKHEDLTKSAQVSIFVPPHADNGKGKVYHRPIRHVALTDYPVIPGLEGWEVVAASNGGEMEMSMRSLAEKLGLEGDDARDDAAIEASIMNRLSTLQKENKELKLQRRELKRGVKGKGEDDEEGDPKPKRIAASNPPSPVMVKMLRENREHKLDALLQAGKVTPAVVKKASERFLADEPLTLSLSATEEEPFDDGFDAFVDALSLNEPVLSFSGGRTGPQGGVKLDKDSIGDPTKNPLLKDVEKRKARAKSA